MFDAIASLIGSGLSYASGQQANKLNREQMTHGIRMRVADARAAGIHPLAALGANVQGTPSQPAFGDAAVSGLTEAGKALMRDRESEGLQRDLLRAQIRQTNAQTMETTARSRSIGNQARQPLGAVGPTPSRAPIDVGPAVGRVHPHPGFSTAQRVQDEYGDLVENAFGLYSLAGSLGETARRRASSERMRRISGYIRGGRRARTRSVWQRLNRTITGPTYR